MGHICNSIIINAPYDLAFDISNDIPHFELDEKAKFTDEQVEGFINKYSKENLIIFKNTIEK